MFEASSILNKIVLTGTFILFGILTIHMTILEDSRKNDGAPLNCGFTQDFFNFIKNSPKYSAFRFQRSDIKCACYGGKATAT